MDAQFFEALRQLVHDKGIPQELILQAVEKGLLAAYKKKYHTDENAVVRIDEQTGEMHLYARKEIVAEVDNPVFDIDLAEARLFVADAEIGDEIELEQPLEEFGRIAAQSARQIIIQKLKDIEKNTIFNEFNARVGELINGYVQREHRGTIYVNLGKTEGILPRSEQSPRESYGVGERIKTYIARVENDENRPPRIILSRGCREFVKKLFELEVPEVYDGIVQIRGIEREAGFRTKLAVYSTRDEIDPVGTCVGMKGIRIQAVIREIEGEKIDVLKYSSDIREYIRNAMSPAKTVRVFLRSEEEKRALVVVGDETQLSLAIGKYGQNVRLASRLTGWNIDVMSEEEFMKSDFVEESVQRAQSIFAATPEVEPVEEYEVEEETRIAEVVGFDREMLEALERNGITTVQDLIERSEPSLAAMESIGPELAAKIIRVVRENFEIVEGEEGEEAEETYQCPNCQAPVTLDMSQCPACGTGLRFE